MKATVERKALADATRAASKFLPRVSAIPALSHFLIEAHSGIVAITATDHEAGRRIELEAEVEAEGDVLVPPALAPIVASGIADTVDLSATPENLTVKIGKATNRLRLGRREDYPEGAEPSIEDGAVLPIESWFKVQTVARFCGGVKAPVSVQGVYFDGEAAVATDSYRLAHVEATSQPEHPALILPARAILNLDATVTEIEADERHVKATVEDGAWWCRPIEGNFPKWRSLIERQGDPAVKVTVSSDRLLGVLSRAKHVTAGTVPLRLTVGNGEVRARVQHQNLGEFEETFAAATEWAGEPGEISVAYNDAYLKSMVEVVESVTISIVDEMRPAEIDGEGWWHGVLMPVRI